MLRIYDEFLEDDTINCLKDRSYRLHVSALIYCSRNLTDGEVTDRAVKVLQAVLGFFVKRHITELCETGLWVPIVGGGYQIRNYLEFNPDSTTVKKERAASRNRMKKLREKRADSGEGAGERSGEQAAEHAAVPYQSLPVPSFSKSRAVTEDQRPSDFTPPQLREIA